MPTTDITVEVDSANIGIWLEPTAFQILPLPDGRHKIINFNVDEPLPEPTPPPVTVHLDGREIASAVAHRAEDAHGRL